MHVRALNFGSRERGKFFKVFYIETLVLNFGNDLKRVKQIFF